MQHAAVLCVAGMLLCCMHPACSKLHVDKDCSMRVACVRLPPGCPPPSPMSPPARTHAGIARVMADVGRVLALIHDAGLIHGDLTTSNMLVREVRGPERGRDRETREGEIER